MKIYKLDTKGKIRELDIYTIEDELFQVSGLLDGKKVEHSKICKPKNVGKTNETTGSEQAISEMESIITKKLRLGYFKTIDEAEKQEVVKPMLAKSAKDHFDKITWPCWGQPKLDGMRMLGKEDTKLSRENKVIETLDHIRLDGITNFIDGEAYAHGYTFQENMKFIKKYRKGETENVNYHVYDLISDKPFKERFEELSNLLDPIIHTNIKLVETIVLNNKKELEEYHDLNLMRGYEGTMIRWGTESYKLNGRSANLLKYKDFKDVALPIIDIVESDRVPGHGIVVIEYNGHESKTGSKISHEDRKDLLTNKHKYIGKTAEIRYFEETDKGALRFPIFMGIRLDK